MPDSRSFFSGGHSNRNTQSITHVHLEASLPLTQRSWLAKPNFWTTETKYVSKQDPSKQTLHLVLAKRQRSDQNKT